MRFPQLNRSGMQPADSGVRRLPLRVAAGISFLAVSAHLLLPLVVTCRTYLSLTRDAPASCCASKAACEPDDQRAATPSWRVDELKCPFCKAASPFRHANRIHAPSLSTTWQLLALAAQAPPASIPHRPPDLSNTSPRSPPIPS